MSGLVIDYGPLIEGQIQRISQAIERHPDVRGRFPVRWLAITLLDDEAGAADLLEGLSGAEDVLAVANTARITMTDEWGSESVMALAALRYDWINEVATAVVDRSHETGSTPTDRIDAVVTNRWLGIPIFLAAMWAVFKLTTDVAAVFLNWIDEAFTGPVSVLASQSLDAIGVADTWFESLVVDGVLAGVGAVLTFIPVLMLLYVALGILEDTGYMARAAFLMDRVMGGIGLPGKSFLPMLVGFGCTVPAIYATRTLENRRDRILTGMLVPFMSCGARLPVYVLVATAFFPAAAGSVVFGMYLLGIMVALGVGVVLRRTVLRGEPSPPAIMELPPYRRPTVRSIRFHTWERTRAFLVDAGSVILITSIVVWLLMSLPVGGSGRFADTDVADSAFAVVAGATAPALDSFGVGTWEAAGSLLSGFVAKEVVIGTMGQVYGVEDAPPADEMTAAEAVGELARGFGRALLDTGRALPGIVGIDLVSDEEESPSIGLTDRIRDEFDQSSGGHGALAGVSFMVFVLLYTPCMAAVAAERRELGARWMWTSIIGQTALAWLAATVVFQVGKAIGL
jgi:ferrous iron transport protein B